MRVKGFCWGGHHWEVRGPFLYLLVECPAGPECDRGVPGGKVSRKVIYRECLRLGRECKQKWAKGQRLCRAWFTGARNEKDLLEWPEGKNEAVELRSQELASESRRWGHHVKVCSWAASPFKLGCSWELNNLMKILKWMHFLKHYLWPNVYYTVSNYGHITDVFLKRLLFCPPIWSYHSLFCDKVACNLTQSCIL